MEIWKDLNKFYAVSNQGRVKSATRIIPSTYGGAYAKEGRILKPSANSAGYLQVTLSYAGKNHSERVHRLVAIAFVENPNGLPQVNHIDGNKLNNCAENLEWVTNAENTKHASRLGLCVKGSTAINAVLNEAKVIDIKRLIQAGCTNRELADLFGVHPATINCIRIGRNWAHVKLDEDA